MSVDLEEFMQDAASLAEDAKRGRKIEEASRKGYVKPEHYIRKVDALEDERLREYAREVIFGIWNTEHRDASLKEIYHGVLKKIAADIDSGEWPKLWSSKPLKRTVDRRVGELHEMNSKFWGSFTCPPCISLKAGYARPNPYVFEEEVKGGIFAAAESA